MTFNETTFKARWRALCATRGIDPIEGATAGNIYTLVNLRAEMRPKPWERVFERRCDHPDDGQALRIVSIPRPTETAKWVQVERTFGDELDILTMDILREVFREIREEREVETLAAMDRRLNRPPLWSKEMRFGKLTDVRFLIV